MTPTSSLRITARPATLGLAVVFIASACVTIAPVEPTTPAQGTPRPTPSGQPNVTSAPTQPRQTTAPTTPDPTLSPGATPTPTDPGASAPPIDPATAAEIDAVVAAVPPIRELDVLEDVPYHFISRDQFIDELVNLAFSEVPEETRRAEERLYKRLGLIPEDADLDQLIIDLYGEGVAAFYRFDNKSFYIVEDGEQELGAYDKVAVAHEYTHALQDQHFHVADARITDLTQLDASLGQLAAIEGDGVVTMNKWTEANLTPDEALELLFQSMDQLANPPLADIPWILRRQLEYPYTEGFAFSDALFKQGGWDAINASISTAIPASTEQVIHPEKYLANEAPVVIDLPDGSSEMNQGEGSWSLVYQQTMGELLMQVVAAGEESPTASIPGLPMQWPHADAVAGWGGDRLNMYEHSSGDWLIDWHTTWDTDTDAGEFEARVHEISQMFDGTTTVTRTGSDVVVQIRPDADSSGLPPV